MVFIIGGAYQGKLTYAKDAFDLAPEDIFTCNRTQIDFGKRCVRSIEEFTFACVQAGADAVAYFGAHRAQWENSILICRDIFCGVVPLGAETARGGRRRDASAATSRPRRSGSCASSAVWSSG